MLKGRLVLCSGLHNFLHRHPGIRVPDFLVYISDIDPAGRKTVRDLADKNNMGDICGIEPTVAAGEHGADFVRRVALGPDRAHNLFDLPVRAFLPLQALQTAGEEATSGGDVPGLKPGGGGRHDEDEEAN